MTKRVLLALGLLLGSAARAEERFFAFSSDYLQALHRCHWAEQVVVEGRRPLVPLVMALNEQKQKINEAREILSPYQKDPSTEIRRAVEGLMNGLELFSLTAAADTDDINAMNNRWELTQRLDARREERGQAVEVIAASVEFFRVALYERADEEGKTVRRPRLAEEEAASLWKQVNLLFGEDLAGGGARTSPVLAAVESLRRALRGSFRNALPPG